MVLMEGDTKTENRVLYLLKSKGPQTAAQLAKRLGVTAMAVRQHLYGFGREGLVAFTDQSRVRVLAAIRREQGYMAECVTRADGSLLLRENHCPICVAAKSCQGLCREELGLFRAVLGTRTHVERTDHILAGASRCAYVITPRS
jgi:predicted ArsR family transcriptional regulator